MAIRKWGRCDECKKRKPLVEMWEVSPPEMGAESRPTTGEFCSWSCTQVAYSASPSRSEVG